MKNPTFIYRFFLLGAPLLFVPCFPRLMAQAEPNGAASQQQAPAATAVLQRDGSHDFDFLIGDWKAHARALRNRLDDSNNPKDWVDQVGRIAR